MVSTLESARVHSGFIGVGQDRTRDKGYLWYSDESASIGIMWHRRSELQNAVGITIKQVATFSTISVAASLSNNPIADPLPSQDPENTCRRFVPI